MIDASSPLRSLKLGFYHQYETGQDYIAQNARSIALLAPFGQWLLRRRVPFAFKVAARSALLTNAPSFGAPQHHSPRGPLL